MTNATEAIREVSKLDIHPATALLPIMSDDDLNVLVEDIKQHGLMEPIIVHDGKILDGRSRWTACVLAGVKPSFMQWNGLGEIPTRYVIAKNLRRLNMSRSQLAALAVELAPVVRSEVKSAAMHMPVQKFDDFLGKLVGVSHNVIFQARKIQEASAADFERLKKGEIACNHGYYKVIKEQNAAIVVPQSSQKMRLTMSERAERVKDLIGQGYLVPQIAAEMGISEELVYDAARRAGISVHSSRAKRLNVTRMIDETVSTAEALTLGLDIVEANFHAVDMSEKERWIASLSGSIRSLNKLLKQLRAI